MTYPDSISARVVLFQGAARSVGVGELVQVLRERGVGAHALHGVAVVTEQLRANVLEEIAAAIAGLLDVDLGDVALAGWARYNRLREAAIRTDPHGIEQVELVTHEITHGYQPRLEIIVDAVPIAEIVLEVAITLLLQPLTATVRSGALVALGQGECTATVSVGVKQVGQILERERILVAAHMIDLRRPIPLLGRPGTPPTAPESGGRRARTSL
ncbi:hypothetical protein NONI108955_06275 [Nocardia ninae]|uniref:Uncharacterized protein n=1 Tax=Nocardia ninae NBRC 108245 TaxID=1210091 RepID=A0A511MJX6_9NOCA|nr:hypothetical protein [Nocardia ninae]GEM40924.1 hypothetical protein NN4_54430 [Nocardia ninae NBRC 108245]